MTAAQIVKQLETWLAPGCNPPPRGALQRIKRQWNSLKPRMPGYYHPIVEDRISLLESRLSR
jgi:hypothetical protein